jgi:hypothetical protein
MRHTGFAINLDMATVTEIVDAYPIEDWSVRIERDERLLFAKPGSPVSKFLQEYPLLQVYHFGTEYTRVSLRRIFHI